MITKTSFWPVKMRSINVNKLIKQINNLNKNKILSLQDKFENQEKSKIIRRLYHIANRTSNLYHFPIIIKADTNSKGMGNYKTWSHDKPYNIDVIKCYKKLSKELKSEGLKCQVIIERFSYEKVKGYFYRTGIIIEVKDV